jgi:hypothetical protein
MPVWLMMHSGWPFAPAFSTDFVKLLAIPGVFAELDIYMMINRFTVTARAISDGICILIYIFTRKMKDAVNYLERLLSCSLIYLLPGNMCRGSCLFERRKL